MVKENIFKFLDRTPSKLYLTHKTLKYKKENHRRDPAIYVN
jgi:hypothetical protein